VPVRRLASSATFSIHRRRIYPDIFTAMITNPGIGIHGPTTVVMFRERSFLTCAYGYSVLLSRTVVQPELC
jgi:hypothetical protein